MHNPQRQDLNKKAICHQPLVSICIPMYNDEEYITRALDSAVNQTLEAIEIVVCDDASTDRSAAIVQEFMEHDDRIVLLRHNQNMLPLEARRTAVNAARSKYVMFLDADDELALNACGICYQAARENDADIVHYRMMFMLLDGSRNTYTEDYLAPNTRLLYGNDIIENLLCADHLPGSHLCTKMWQRDVIVFAYSQIPQEQTIGWLEDTLVHFIALTQTKKYVGLYEELYKYYFGVGGTGQPKISLTTVEKFLTSNRTFSLIQAFVNDGLSDKKMQATATKASSCIKLGGICSFVKDILVRIQPDLLRQALSLSLKHWTIKDMFDALQKYHSEQIPILEKCLDDAGFSHLNISNKFTSPQGIIDLAEQYWRREDTLVEMIKYDRKLLPDTSLESLNTIGMVYFGFWGGGIERVMSLLIDIYASMGIKTVVFTEQDSCEKDFVPTAEYTRIVLPSTGDGYHKRAEVLLDSIKEFDIGLVISHVNPAHYVFWDALLIRAMKVPTLMYYHNTFALVLYDRKDIAWFLKQQAYFWPYDGMLVLSRVEALYFRAFHEHVFIIPNPMTANNVEPLKTSIKQKGKPFELVWLARLHAHYNYQDIVDIMTYVVEREPDVHLNVLASIPENDEDFNHVVAEIDSRGLGEIIAFKGYQTDISPYLEAADVHLLLSEMGGWAMTVLEAASYGVPTVCYDLPWLELWRNNKGMLISDPCDKHSTAQNILSLIEGADLLARLSGEAKETAQKFSRIDHMAIWQKVFSKMNNFEHQDTQASINSESNLFDLWGECYDVQLDNASQETAKIMIRTYNRFLRGCL